MWLAEQGRLGPVAQRLGVHPQTARYRLGRLRELFGASLDDPDDALLARARAAHARLVRRREALGHGLGALRAPADRLVAPARAGSVATSGPSAPDAISSDQK